MIKSAWENPRFYEKTLESLLVQKVVNRNSRILVVCGGESDRIAFNQLSFENVVISNLDTSMSDDSVAPFKWSFQDAENLDFTDQSFDFCVVHEGLHHCHSPHRALIEMYRVARIGILVIEPCDSLFTKVGRIFNLGQTYEHAAIFFRNCKSGGVANSSTPNFVYRWTENEIAKTVNCFAPYGKHKFTFRRRLMVPWINLTQRKRIAPIRILFPFLFLLQKIDVLVPSIGNNMAAVVIKPVFPRDLHPWLVISENGIEPNIRYLSEKFHGDPNEYERSKPESPQ